MKTFQKTTLVTLPFSILTHMQKKHAAKDGGITGDLNQVNPDAQIKVKAEYLTRLQRGKYLTQDQQQICKDWPSVKPGRGDKNAQHATQPDNNGRTRGTRRDRNRNRGNGLNGTDLNCGDGTLSVRLFPTLAAIMAFIGNLPEKSAVVLNGLSAGLTQPVYALIYLKGGFKDFTQAMGEIPAATLKKAIQYASHQNGVQMDMIWVPLLSTQDNGTLFTAVVQGKTADVFLNKADKQALKDYLQAFTNGAFTNDGTVQGQRFNNAILGAVPYTDGVRNIISWEKDGNYAALPLPTGVKGDIRASTVGDQMLLVAQANGDCLYGITPQAQRSFLNHEGNAPWAKSDKLPGQVEDISLGIYNQVTKGFSVIVTVEANGKDQNRFIPVGISTKEGKPAFTPDIKNAVKGDNGTADIPAVVRVKQSFLATVGHGGDDMPAVSFIPRQSWPTPFINMMNVLSPQPPQQTAAH